MPRCGYKRQLERSSYKGNISERRSAARSPKVIIEAYKRAKELLGRITERADHFQSPVNSQALAYIHGDHVARS